LTTPPLHLCDLKPAPIQLLQHRTGLKKTRFSLIDVAQETKVKTYVNNTARIFAWALALFITAASCAARADHHEPPEAAGESEFQFHRQISGHGSAGPGEPVELIALPDQRILMVTTHSVYFVRPSDRSVFAFQRFNPLDPAWHSGSGARDKALRFPPDWTGAALQSDQKLVLVGNADSSEGKRLVLARVNPDGKFDRDFGLEGVAFLKLAGLHESTATRVLVQADGRLLVAGLALVDGNNAQERQYRVFLVRYLDNGDLDLAFGDDGLVFLGEDELILNHSEVELVQQHDGRILIMATRGAQENDEITMLPWIRRVLQDGQPDPSFGNNGQFQAEASTGFSPAHLVQSNKSPDIYVVGSVIDGDGKGNDEAMQCAIGKISEDGIADMNFGDSDGYLRFSPDDASECRFTNLIEQDNGDLLAAGYFNLAEPDLDQFGGMFFLKHIPASALSGAALSPDYQFSKGRTAASSPPIFLLRSPMLYQGEDLLALMSCERDDAVNADCRANNFFLRLEQRQAAESYGKMPGSSIE
jgi:uncharacterized delta-60 repeat protein